MGSQGMIQQYPPIACSISCWFTEGCWLSSMGYGTWDFETSKMLNGSSVLGCPDEWEIATQFIRGQKKIHAHLVRPGRQ